ncbi:MAG: lipoate--protein ligase family protein [Pirellulales bacterium]|nr:lipoate--protein ligase family protein [Pirellulales bacterium]
MTPRTRCSLLIDPPASGAWNMAVDEALLESFSEQEGCCLRFYRWQEPTLSLGYFQSVDDRRQHAPSLACPIVRRASGGGAIVHDVELTYSLVVAAENPLAQQRGRLYDTVHSTLIDSLAELGVAEASLFGSGQGFSPDDEPFLCFQRRSPGDVVCDEAKIAGSAQRRRRGAVLQHGSVLLGRSRAAPELPGLKELTQREVACGALIATWLSRLESCLALAFSRHSLTHAERRRAEELVLAKYASDDWTRDRNRRPD